MPLDNLNKELYSQTADKAINREHERSEYDPLSGPSGAPNPFEGQEKWNQPQKGLTPSGKKKLWIGLIILGLILLAIGGAYFYSWWTKNAFHQDRVEISFVGPKEADSTQQVKYGIHYKNNNRVALKGVILQLHYTENFQPTDNVNLKFLSPSASKIFLGDIKPMSEGEVDLRGIFYAPKDFPVYLNVEMLFTPSNGNSELKMENQIGVNIATAPVILDISAPQKLVSGDIMEYEINYENLDFRQMNGAQIRIDFPQGFQMNNAEPKPSEKDIYWYLGNLESGQSGKIKIQGQINGENGETKQITASLGRMGQSGEFIVFNKQEQNTLIVTPVLDVKQSLEGRSDNNIAAGEILKYKISYYNTGDIGLRDAIISAEIKGEILDFSKIQTSGGSFDAAKGLITWKASDAPGLANIAPKTGGSVLFSIPVKDIIVIENKLDKNFIVSSIAKIDSPDIPTPIDSNKIIDTDRMELRLASKVLFESRGYYNDTKIPNTGPIPMVVGTETTFTLHWLITNISNDIKDVKVMGSLPSGVRWTGKIFPLNDKISYNERTNQLVWDAGDVIAGSGILMPPREIIFQVGVTPQINQVGQPIQLLGKSSFVAKDGFINKDIVLQGEAKDTQLAEDSAVGYANGKVAR